MYIALVATTWNDNPRRPTLADDFPALKYQKPASCYSATLTPELRETCVEVFAEMDTLEALDAAGYLVIWAHETR